MTLVGTVFTGTLKIQFNSWENHIRLFYISLYIVRTHFFLEYIKAFTTLIHDTLHLFPFPQTNKASACSGLWVTVALTLLPLPDPRILELSFGSVTPFLWLYSKFSAENLRLVQFGQLLTCGPVSSDLIERAHAGYMAVSPLVSERVGNSQGTSRSTWHTEIGKVGEDFNKKMLY